MTWFSTLNAFSMKIIFTYNNVHQIKQRNSRIKCMPTLTGWWRGWIFNLPITWLKTCGAFRWKMFTFVDSNQPATINFEMLLCIYIKKYSTLEDRWNNFRKIASDYTFHINAVFITISSLQKHHFQYISLWSSGPRSYYFLHYICSDYCPHLCLLLNVTYKEFLVEPFI